MVTNVPLSVGVTNNVQTNPPGGDFYRDTIHMGMHSFSWSDGDCHLGVSSDGFKLGAFLNHQSQECPPLREIRRAEEDGLAIHAFGADVDVTVLEVDILPKGDGCPGETVPRYKIEYFWERHDDNDEELTYAKTAEDYPDPPGPPDPLPCPREVKYASEELQQVTIPFTIGCTDKDSTDGDGVNDAEGQDMKCYYTPMPELEIATLSFDLRGVDFSSIPGVDLLFFLGTPEGDFWPLDEFASFSDVGFNQIHVDVPSEDLATPYSQKKPAGRK